MWGRPSKLARRGKRSESARKRRKHKLMDNSYDRETGEVINLQEYFVQFEIVPKNLGFLNVNSDRFNTVGLMCLYEGEVLINRYGSGTIQTHPEVFI